MINMVNDSNLSSLYNYLDEISRTFPSMLCRFSSASDRVLSFLPVFPDKNLYCEYKNSTHLIKNHAEDLYAISRQISQYQPSFPASDISNHLSGLEFLIHKTKSLQNDVQKFLGLHEKIRFSLPHKEPFSSLEYAIDQSLNSCRQFAELLETLEKISCTILDRLQYILEDIDLFNNAMFTRIPHDFL